ncbi:CU044_5270 family protein [Nonomuraea sp. NPDC050556]|uniref:CU044_5270 family protein n=1 Tax=Nonomuraea sp. NPDC050556 TaxID=3364369 RepID=UPI0037B48502
MNPIDQLRAARPAHLDTPLDPATRTAELTHAMAGPRQRRRRSVRLPVWGLGLGGAAAAATAVAVLVAGSPAPRAPSVALPSPTFPAFSARTVLLAAAERAERAPAASGDWWHTVGVRRTLFQAVDGDYTVMDRQRIESWTPSATGKDQWSRTQTLGAEPVDRAAWERAGSPREIVVKVDRKKPLPLSVEPGKVDVGHAPLVDGDKVFWLGRNVTMDDLRGLPSSPDGLKAWLLRSYKGHDTESDRPMGSDKWLFAVTVGLVMDMPVTPRVRGAAFRMLADLDTIKVTPDVADAEGRRGTAVALDGERLIIDEAAGVPLAQESPRSSYVVLESTWTDTPPSR